MARRDSRDKAEALFPALPARGTPSKTSRLRSRASRIVAGTCQIALVTILAASAHAAEIKHRLKRKDRKHAEEERSRHEARRTADAQWTSHSAAVPNISDNSEKPVTIEADFRPLEGGRDRLERNVQYYARRCGLECETIDVITSDGFILDLWHIYDPAQPRSTEKFAGKKRYPILMIHGLLQSSGAYTCTDDHSFAFHFAKAGFDVWLGNNRCGFHPRHQTLKSSDPRMWSWNIKEMATLDLPALVGKVLALTGFSKLALVGHSQGTSQILIALHKAFVPELGEKISIACLLAPAAYSGPILNNPAWYFKVMIRMPPRMWRVVFGKHVFLGPLLPLMDHMPMKMVSAIGYPLFHYLFKWSDRNWDKGLRARSFMWAPTYVSSEHMRWWIGRDGFVKQGCILNTREESEQEAAVDVMIATSLATEAIKPDVVKDNLVDFENSNLADSWFDKRVPPLAIWIAECDELVDGPRLLRRFQCGREPHAQLYHAEVLEDYEHLDVIWAVDAIEKVGKGVMNAIWSAIEKDVKESCFVPRGLSGT